MNFQELPLHVIEQSNLIINTYKHWLNIDLVDPNLNETDKAKALYEAPFVVVSHGTEASPVFNYANKTAQKLWELSWEEFTQMPSNKSVEVSLRDEREVLLSNLKNTGFSKDYRGTRISNSGKRFDIINTVVWNMFDQNGIYRGQAASFAEWKFL